MLESLMDLVEGLSIAVTPTNILYCFIGCMVGMLVGVLPGIGPSEATALLIPLSYGLDSVTAIIMLCGIYYGGMYGGTITSVLINTPGEAASVITCMDGYPLAKQGRAGVALKVAALGSFVGGIISTLGLALLGPTVADFALSFGPSEQFALLVFGMSMVIGLMGKSLIRGLVAVCIGLSLAMVGMDPVSGTIRYAYGLNELVSGLDVVTLSMGLFGLSEILGGHGKPQRHRQGDGGQFLQTQAGRSAAHRHAIIRGSFLGFFMGLIPGTSSAVPALISYSMEKNLSKHPEKFGTACLEGRGRPGNREQLLRWRRNDSAVHAGHSLLADHRHFDGRVHDARHDPRPDAVYHQPGCHLGHHRQYVRGQRHFADSQHAPCRYVGQVGQHPQ